MGESRFLCTAANRQGIWPDPGMLGRGYMAFPDASATEFRGGASIGGYYSIDDYHAALFLAMQRAFGIFCAGLLIANRAILRLWRRRA